MRGPGEAPPRDPDSPPLYYVGPDLRPSPPALPGASDPVVTVDAVRQKLTGILGNLDLALARGWYEGARMEMKDAQESAKALARMCDEAEAKWKRERT